MPPLVLAFALASCGQSREQQVRDAAQGFENAMSDNDLRGACKAMSREAKAQLPYLARAERPSAPRSNCEQALKATGFPGAERAVAGEVDFYNDSSAKVAVDVPGDRDPDSGGDVEVIKQDGAWRIGDDF